jgi:uncharacterized SAM-binding protein YcdF (DUF218 family)
MFFILSKFLIFLLNPLIWVIGGLSIALIFSRQKVRRWALAISFFLLVLLSNPFLLDRFAEQWDIGTGPIQKSQVFSCAIVLGGFSSEGTNGQGFFNASSDRFIQALKLKTTGRVSHLLITGGNSEVFPGKFRESLWVRHQLKLLNIADSSILIESTSRNTFENARFSKRQLIKRNLAPPYLLVTSAFHMRRSLYTFQKEGIPVQPYSSNFIAGNQTISLEDFVPRAEVLNKWSVYLKEVIGFGIYYVRN